MLLGPVLLGGRVVAESLGARDHGWVGLPQGTDTLHTYVGWVAEEGGW